MRGLLLLLLLAPAAASKWPLRGPSPHVEGVPASFDCGMRKLAYTYGKKLIPRMGDFESLYYALDLNSPDCHTEMKSDGHVDDRKKPEVPKGAIFVSPKGDDLAPGTFGAPLLSVQKAVDMAVSTDAKTVVLRGGVHYLDDTLFLDAKHSGLTIMGHPGEKAEMSGGKKLKVTWKPYNVTPGPSPSPGWVEADNMNYVWGCKIDNKTFLDLGRMDDWKHCQTACQGRQGCHSYTWHDANQGGWARQCIGRTTTGQIDARSQSGHFSGHDSQVTPGGSPSPSVNPNIWVADIKGQIDDVRGLQINGERATRARYPNMPAGIEASCGYGCMVSGGSAKWTPPDFNKYGKVDFYTDTIPDHRRNTTNNWFNNYMIGVNGLCSVYDPPVSYWCSEHPSGGGAFAFRTPNGLTYDFPHGPYKNGDDATLFVWRPSRWANWMFDVGHYDSKTSNFTFGKGGNQGARGNNNGGDFFIEGLMEELDYPGEFFHDKRAGKLYLFHNGTGAPPADATVVVPQKQVLVNASGTQWNPVKNVKLQGIQFTASAFTYMMPHGVPSAGDWALDRYGAVFLQGTENYLIEDCTFERLDGNGVMVSGYNRDATIQNSDFAFLGGNAVAAWGYTNETDYDPGRPGIKLENAPAAGVDGTDGEHPRRTTVQNCTAREVGLYEKQSSFFIQAKTAESRVLSNVFFNGPRAGVNSNDGFGGGDEIAYNLVFSTCRESGDHGPFNSWDRQPFLTTVRTGQPSMIMQWRDIHNNFFIDNYSPQEAVDNDDGSCYYHTRDNFLVYGRQAMKNDFGGHDNHHYNNVDAYVGHALGTCGTIPGHEDYFYGNYVVMTGSSVGTCLDNRMHDNQYFTPDGKIGSGCSGYGGTVAKTPSDDAILNEARKKLGLPVEEATLVI